MLCYLEKFRAQVLSDDGLRWVDGGLYVKESDAQADADRLAALYGNATRVIAGL